MIYFPLPLATFTKNISFISPQCNTLSRRSLRLVLVLQQDWIKRKTRQREWRRRIANANASGSPPDLPTNKAETEKLELSETTPTPTYTT